jgi:hypothetical protein
MRERESKRGLRGMKKKKKKKEEEKKKRGKKKEERGKKKKNLLHVKINKNYKLNYIIINK